MFERFTERARQVVVLAQDEARTLGHAHLGTEHLLLGLLREEEGLAHRALGLLGVSLDSVRERVRALVGEGEAAPRGQIPFTPRAKKVLELALREALSLGHDYIGTEHILLGLARENEGAAATILLEHDADSERIHACVVHLLGGPGAVAPPERRMARLASTLSMHPSRSWEYRIERRARVEEEWLNELGARGWELVAVVPEGDELAAVLKRRRGPGLLRAAG